MSARVELTDAERKSLQLASDVFLMEDEWEAVFTAIDGFVAARVAEALRDAAENVFMDESLEGRTAMVRTNEAWRLLLNTLAAEYGPSRADA